MEYEICKEKNNDSNINYYMTVNKKADPLFSTTL